MAQFLDPKYDLTFKRVFGEHKHLCISLINELWLRFFTEVNEKSEEIPKELLKNEHIREAVGYMERGAYTKEQLTAYDKWKVDLMTARSMLDDAETIGLEKGEAIGLEKGEAIGLEKGLVKAAINCKTAGYSIDETAMITGLTSGQVIKIFKKI